MDVKIEDLIQRLRPLVETTAQPRIVHEVLDDDESKTKIVHEILDDDERKPKIVHEILDSDEEDLTARPPASSSRTPLPGGVYSTQPIAGPSLRHAPLISKQSGQYSAQRPPFTSHEVIVLDEDEGPTNSQRDTSLTVDLGEDPTINNGDDSLDVDAHAESEEEYDTLHTSLDITCDSNWKKIKLSDRLVYSDDVRDQKTELGEAVLAASHMGEDSLKRHFKHRTFAYRTTHVRPRSAAENAKLFEEEHLLWNIGRKARAHYSMAISFESPAWMARRHGLRARFLHLRQVTHKRFSPGAINAISQADDMIAVASCVVGEVDAEDYASRTYNSDSSLKIMNAGRIVPLQGHSRETQHGVKHYTTGDVHFDPTDPHRLVSCGQDGRVIVWDCSGIAEGDEALVVKKYTYREGRLPLGLRFKPNDSVYAVGDSWGRLRIHQGSRTVIEHLISPENYIQPVQSLTWGREITQNVIFATTASDTSVGVGQHKAYDVNSSSLFMALDNSRGGECLHVSPRGDELALVTCNENQRFELALYDIRSEGFHGSTRKTELEPLPRWYEGNEEMASGTSVNRFPSSVNDVLYSPDGVYIAVARSNNCCHVYDSRYLTRVLHRFHHSPATEGTIDDGKFGVYKIDWIVDPNTNRLHLVSGGADGCVRLWDVGVGRSRQRPNGVVIAQSDAYVGWYDLGDPAKGRKPVVLGDGSGTIVIME